MLVTGQTKVMFLLAHPVGHVRGTAILNAHFEATGKNVVASPLHVLPDDLEASIGAIRRFRNVVGFGVTIPHKIPILRHLDEVTPRARDVGAVNFVRRDVDGRLTGDNMDGIGFVAGLRRSGVDVEGKRVLQIGAGGAGRAIAFALAEAGVGRLRIANRDESKALQLAESVAARTACKPTVGPAMPESFDIVVNTTSLGMKEDDPLPVDPSRIDPGTVLADIIMAPPITKLMSQAMARGCKTIGGKTMLDEQMGLVLTFLNA